MKHSIQSILFLSVAVLLVSCSGGSFQKAKSGMLYKIIADGKGAALKSGNYVKFNVVVKQKDSVTYNSFGKIPAYTMIDSAGRPYDVSEVLPKMKEGDSAVIIQLADSLAKQMGQMPPGLKKGDKITISLRILKVMTDLSVAQADFQKEMDELKTREVNVLEEYIKSKKINAVKTEKGVFVEIINPGSGAKPDSGKQVSVMYTGSNMEGKKFDSNVDTVFKHSEPLKFVIGQMGMIPGFEEAVKQLMKGGKAKAYIPSMMGYGMQGSPPLIKPYETLIFEMELIDITDAPKQTAPVMPPNNGEQNQ
jgi:FKBP-type peptidyl-prolyl cis-trans isomerase